MDLVIWSQFKADFWVRKNGIPQNVLLEKIIAHSPLVALIGKQEENVSGKENIKITSSQCLAKRLKQLKKKRRPRFNTKEGQILTSTGQ